MSGFENFSLSTSNQEVPYDGYLYLGINVQNSTPGSFYINDTKIYDFAVSGPSVYFYSDLSIPLKKGDNIRVTNTALVYLSKFRYYKKRNYTYR